jgi:glucose-6-phosphate 1-dehydrogenase
VQHAPGRARIRGGAGPESVHAVEWIAARDGENTREEPVIVRIEPQCRPAAPPGTMSTPDPCVVVVFGASGDLARRKVVPALYGLAADGALPDGHVIIGFARTPLAADAFREQLRPAVARFARRQPLDAPAWDRFARRIEYVSGGYDDPGAYAALGERLAETDRRHGTAGNRLYYLATPPAVFPEILRQLRATHLLHAVTGTAGAPWSRVVIEKPFGRDLASARELNRLVAEVLDERQTFRIDHYLGKETVQNILVFRFGNAIFEHLWNRKYIDHVQVTAAEDIGIEGRGRFYDGTGVLRDVVQSHLLELLALCALEPPNSFDADDVRDEKVQVLRALRPIAGDDVARLVVAGQYRGYRDEPDVARDSQTPTFVSLRVLIDNWRWQGVPFYLRAGKRLRARSTEIAIQFQPIPLCLFGRTDACSSIEPNVLTLRIQPDEGIELRFASKTPGDALSVGDVTMDFSYARAFARPSHEAYERLLLDCMRGDATLFVRRDAVERAWEFVTPILEAWEAGRGGPVAAYEPGSAGPAASDALLAADGRRWREIR